MKLFGHIDETWDASSFVARVTCRPDLPKAVRANHALLFSPGCDEHGFASLLTFDRATARAPTDGSARLIHLEPHLNYLGEGDVIRVKPRAREVQVLYRRQSRHNCLIPTTKCNASCQMCSQPFTGHDPEHLLDLMDAVPLLDPATATLGISGGEPTLLGRKLVDLVRRIRVFLPRTSLEILSNAILFRYFRFAQDIAQAGLPGLVIGVPIHADLPELHDRIAGRKGAFDATMVGLLNLQRVGVQVELRVILQKPVLHRLTALGEFIARNLCFANHVAFMGLEYAGRATSTWDALWTDPAEFRDVLAATVKRLDQLHMNVSVYNLPLCVLDPSLWTFACQSISEWKNEFPEQCNACPARPRCCGLFRLEGNPLAASVRPLDAIVEV
jgi:His-Xaa-Ser repeat-associated downstream radical SAM protein